MRNSPTCLLEAELPTSGVTRRLSFEAYFIDPVYKKVATLPAEIHPPSLKNLQQLKLRRLQRGQPTLRPTPTEMQFSTTALPLLLLLLTPFTHALPTEYSTPNIPYLLTKCDTCIDYACHSESPDQDESSQNINPGCLLCVSWGDRPFKRVG